MHYTRAVWLFILSVVFLIHGEPAKASGANGKKYDTTYGACIHLGVFATPWPLVEACRQVRDADMHASPHGPNCANSTMRVEYYYQSSGQVMMHPSPACSYGSKHFVVRELNCGAADSAVGKPCAPTPRNLGAKHCDVMGGNPVNLATGNKYQRETDYQGTGAFPLVFERHYNSHGSGNGTLGHRWTHTFERFIDAPLHIDYPKTAWLKRADGEILLYRSYSAGVWTTDKDHAATIVELTSPSGARTGWRFTDENDKVEEYDASGRLITITTRSGIVQQLAYTSGRLATVTHSFGHTLTFNYDASGRLSGFTDPAGASTTFTYDGAGNSSAVTYPDSTTREYFYDEPGHVASGSISSLLTGIEDESGQRYASFSYNAASHAIVSEHAGGANRIDVTLNTNGSATVLDALGASRTRGFSKVDGLYKAATMTGGVCSMCGLAASYTYDTEFDLASSTDFRGTVTNYVYDARHLQTSRTEAFGSPQARTIATTWHPTLRLPDVITHSDHTTDHDYDSNGNLTLRTVTDTSTSATRAWTYTYNSYGQVLTENGPRTDVSDVTTYTYYTCATGNECGQPQAVTNALSQTKTFNTYNAHGHPLTITDPNGVVTTLTYDLRQRLTSRSVGSETTSFEYWPTGLLKKATLPDGSFTLYTYDAAQRLIQVEDGEGSRIEYTLDAMGNRTEEKVYGPSSTLSRARTEVFNNLNQRWKQVGAAGTAAVTTTYGYDNEGNQTSVAAPLARNTGQLYDELNRLKQITDPGSGITQFAYDANDNLTSVTDPKGLITNYAYTGFGDLTEQVSPDTGTTVTTYDSGGNLATSTDARSKTGTYSYDALNRVTSVAFPDRTITYSYDFGTNGVGRLTGASDVAHSLAWSYDAQGRLTGKGQTVGSITKSVGYGYTNGNLTSLVTSSGQTITYGYANGRIDSITLNGSTTVLSDVLYEPFGPVAGWTWGNSTLAARVYDLDGKPTDIDSAGAYTYAYDDAFRITGITDLADSTKTWSYGYDLLDRLNAASRTAETIGYTYDANGNRLSQTGTTAASYTVPPSSNRVTSITGTPARTYGYDASGNTTGYGGLSFTYTDAGRMSSVTSGSVTTNYLVNALGQRVRKSSATATIHFVYDESGHLLGEYDATGTLIQETIWMGDIPVATLRPNGSGVSVFYVHTDHLNTPRRISRPGDNAILWRWDSDPFGSAAANEDPDGDTVAFSYNVRFPGQYFDAETGLSYNYFRDYDPAVGRYVESDPIGLAGGLNTYSYTRSNPISFIDPDGQNAVLPGVIPRPIPFPGSIPRPFPGTIDPVMPMVPPDADDMSDVTDESLRRELEQCPRDCRGYLKQLRKHEEKLRQYRSNPDLYDNLGFLKFAPPDLRKKIIDGRIRNLERQIQNFRRKYEECMRNGMA